MTKKLNYLILCLLLIFGIPVYWLYFESDPGDARPMDVSIEELRNLSNSIEGARPNAIHYEDVALFTRPGNLVAAGQGLRGLGLSILAYELRFADQAPVVIGAGMTLAQADLLDYDKYRLSAQTNVIAAMERASRVIPLDDSPGQLDGINALNTPAKTLELQKDIERQWRRDIKGKPYSLAPGIVIIPAPDLPHRQRMVYVRLANGREYLFTGPIAPIRQSWRKLRPPARVVTDSMEPDTRRQLFSWLMTVRALKRQAPELTVVSGYRVPDKSGLIRHFTHARDR